VGERLLDYELDERGTSLIDVARACGLVMWLMMLAADRRCTLHPAARLEPRLASADTGS
jgi:hypothetical protein